MEMAPVTIATQRGRCSFTPIPSRTTRSDSAGSVGQLLPDQPCQLLQV